MIRQSILAHKKFKIQPEDIISTSKGIKIAIPTHHTPSTKPTTSKRIRKPVPITAPEALFAYIQHLKRTLPNLAIAGAPLATRAVLQTSETKPSTTKLLVEGYGLAECMRTPGVDGLCTTTNSVLETYSVLGIEAARATIAAEISLVMADMDIDPRHMALLADVMTYRGSVLGITRFGLAKMRESVLQLASFEKTPDHLFDAAWRMKRDQVKGVSECIIMGQAMGVGTGAMRIVKHLGFSEIEDELGRKRCVFEEAWQRRVDRRRGVIGIT
jgi:DNA-directed RNA polymerase III subunit RPC1